MLTSINTAIHRLHIEGGQSIANAIRSLASNRIIVAGQANYIYTLGQDLAGDRMQGDSGQYGWTSSRWGTSFVACAQTTFQSQ